LKNPTQGKGIPQARHAVTPQCISAVWKLLFSSICR